MTRPGVCAYCNTWHEELVPWHGSYICFCCEDRHEHALWIERQCFEFEPEDPNEVY